MPQEGFKRKRAANLSADGVDYSRSKGKDEIDTIQLLTEYREIIAQIKGWFAYFFHRFIFNLFAYYIGALEKRGHNGR